MSGPVVRRFPNGMPPRGHRAAETMDYYSVVQPDTVDLVQVFRGLRRQLKLILLVMGLGLLVSTLYVMSAKPIYTATAQLLIDPRPTKVIQADAVAPGLGQDKAIIDSQVGIIRSRAIAERVINQYGVVDGEETRGRFSGLGQRIGEMMSSATRTVLAWFGEAPEEIGPSGKGTDAALMLGRDELSQTDLDRFLLGLVVARKEPSYIIAVSYSSTHPARAARIADAFVEAYIADQLDAKTNATRNANVWLKERLAQLRQLVAAQEAEIGDLKAKYSFFGVTDSTGRSTDSTPSERMVGDVLSKLEQAIAAEDAALTRAARLQAAAQNSVRLLSMAEVQASPVIISLRQALADATRRSAEISRRYGPRHPAVADIGAEVASLRGEVDREIERIVTAAGLAHEDAKTQVSMLKARLADLTKGLAVEERNKVRLRELEREANANRGLYNTLLTRYKETSEQESLQTADARVIAKAPLPTMPTYPRKPLALAFGLIAGLSFGIIIGLAREFMNKVFRTPEEVEQVLGMPYLAWLPSVDLRAHRAAKPGLRIAASAAGAADTPAATAGKQLAEPRAQLRVDQGNLYRYVLDHKSSEYSQGIFAIKNAIESQSLNNEPAKVIAVVSALPGEGKSTLAFNLAQYAASTGRKVLLVDCDLRSTSITAAAYPNPKASIVDLLKGDVSIADVIAKDSESGLYFCPGPHGTQIANPMDVLGSARMASFLFQARERYDLVVLDTSPLQPVIDTYALIGHTDRALLVVRSASTTRDEVLSSLKRVYFPRDKFLGVVLNRTEPRRETYSQNYAA